MTQFSELPAFTGLNETQVANFLAASEPLAVAAGESLCVEGMPGSHLYILRCGQLRVHHGNQDLAALMAPCVVGELELLTEGPHAASVTAIEPCEGYAIAYADLRRRLNDGDPGSLKVVYNVAKTLASRLAAMDEKFLEMLEGRNTVLNDLDSLKKKLFGEWS